MENISRIIKATIILKIISDILKASLSVLFLPVNTIPITLLPSPTIGEYVGAYFIPRISELPQYDLLSNKILAISGLSLVPTTLLLL
jgi:hypothetical protein